jgi:carboxypeptidase T
MKIAKIIILLATVVSFLFADSPEKYSRVSINVPDKSILEKIWKTGIDYEGSSGKLGGRMEFIAGSFELQQLRNEGISYSIVKDDISKISSEGYANGPANALGFGYGSMGGFYTFTEVEQQLDSMHALYPLLITEKEAIGSSQEGRNIWTVKISDNPETDEENEPEVLYTALHHAREPAGMMSVIYYMWWLLENYGKDSQATYLVNNRQMWFIPVVNPDGYAYNQSLYTPPSNFGYWRKNRRINEDGSRGVDLNRNYGPEYMWNSPYGGSSTVPSSDTYRGTSPFSEPEIFAIQGFIWFHNIKTCLNYHTYSNLLVYPWGYEHHETDDSLTFREFAFYLVEENRYLSGRDEETVNYVTRGGSDDFMYGDLSKPKIFAMTPEVGTSGFWAPTNEILPLAQENLTANIYLSYVAGQYTSLKTYDIKDKNGDGFLQPGEDFDLLAIVKNMGLGDAKNLHIKISENSPYFDFKTSEFVISNLIARSESTFAFPGSVSNTNISSAHADIFLHFSDSLGYSKDDTVTIFLGTPQIILADSGNEGMSNWTIVGDWGITGDAHTPPSAFTDSPGSDYPENQDASMIHTNNINLYGYKYCQLRFWTKWAIEPTFDFGQIEISTNGGLNWITQKTSLSHRGSGRGKQASGTWGYDGFTPGLDWIEQQIDLTPYINNMMRLRFSLYSDASSVRDGWYIDDIRIYGYRSEVSFLSISDNGVNSEGLIFGEAGSATDGLDPDLGEAELSPKPPAGTFDIRWKIDGTNGSKSNYQDTLSISNPNNIFVAEFQPGSSGYPIILCWNPAYLKHGGWHLRDGFTHGSLFNLNMWFDTTFAITDTAIKSVEIIHTQEETLNITNLSGWNLMSLPVITPDRVKAKLYPTAITDAFAYEGSYVTAETLNYHQSYWIKFADSDTTSLAGIPIVGDSIDVPPGWWMIAGLGCPVLIEQMVCNPPPCRPFVFRGVYSTELTINPGEGFWIKGPLTLSYKCIHPFSGTQTTRDIDIDHCLNKIAFENEDGKTSNIYFTENSTTIESEQSFELPPRPPEGSFDVRFRSNRYIDHFSPEGKTQELGISLQSTKGPIIVSWEISRENRSIFEICQESENGWKQTLVGNGKLILPDGGNRNLVLKQKSTEEIPHRFSVEQNYPNPFNPTTTISFNIPQPSVVNVTVFNTIGQTVAVLADRKLYPAGQVHLTFTSNNLPSGVYYYSVDAQGVDGNKTFKLTKKMILLQ